LRSAKIKGEYAANLPVVLIFYSFIVGKKMKANRRIDVINL